MLDFSTELGQQAANRLQNEPVIWLVTVGGHHAPYARPVWFWWDGQAFLIYSRPNAAKVRHILQNPLVSLHFNCTPWGDEVVVFNGEAMVDDSLPLALEQPNYLEKYRQGIANLGETPERFSEMYNTPILVRPTKLFGF